MSRLTNIWNEITDSLWLVPAVSTALAIALAFALVHAQSWVPVGPGVPEIEWIFGGGTDAAIGVLSAIAGSIITVTGVVFSVTIVALQLASSQFTPRVLRNFMADRPNQLVLGVFIGTFAYSLVVLRSIGESSSNGDAFIPSIAITGAVVLALVSIGFLIFFIHHVAASIRVENIIDRVTRHTLSTIRDRQNALPAVADHTAVTMDASIPLTAQASGYIKHIGIDALLEAADASGISIEVKGYIGDFVLEGSALAMLSVPVDAEHEQAIRDAFVLGADRTPHQDYEFGIVEIADIAIKALSPGINDPTTAMIAIDRLGEIVLHAGRCERASIHRTAQNNRVVEPQRPFEATVARAFRQIGHFGRGNPVIVDRLLGVFSTLASLLPAERRSAFAAEAAALHAVVPLDDFPPAERHDISARFSRLAAL